MDGFRKRYTDVTQADKARDNLLNDLLQALDDVQKTIESNAFVLVLIDGDSLQFLNHLVRQGIHGGDEAAKLLRKAVFEYLRYDQNYKRDYKTVIRMYANLRGLSKTYVDKGILQNNAAFGEFVLGFNKAHPLCDFVDAGNHKEAADTKLKETLNLYISNVHCKQIIFGAPTDSAYASFLNSYVDVDAPARIRLLKGPPFSWEFQNIIHKFQWTEFKGVFRDSLLYNDDSKGNLPADNTSLLDKPITDTANHASLLPWRLTSNNDRQRSTQRSKFAVDDSHPSSSNVSEAHLETRDGVTIESKQNRKSELKRHDEPDDKEIVNSLVLVTRENLERNSRALDFGAVKAQVEQLHGLGPEFWGSSEKDKWFSRSKNVIKWAVEEWIGETDTPPPKNATWMLRYFPEGHSPSAIIQSAPWRTKADKDYQTPSPRKEVNLSRAPPTAPRAERSAEPIMKGSVLRNSAGQRIDWPVELQADEQIINSIRKRNPRLCNIYYLRGACPNRNCKYDHDSRLNEVELEALLYLARCHPCNFGTSCDNPSCTSGHKCPNGKQCTYGNKCRFAGTHDMDTTPVKATNMQAAPVQQDHVDEWNTGKHVDDWDADKHVHEWDADEQPSHENVIW